MAGKALLAVQYERQYAEAIDRDYKFTTVERTAYLSNPLRYSGQVIIDSDEDALYRLNVNRDTWILIAGGGIAGHTIQDVADISFTQRTNLKFIGATVTDNVVDDTTEVNITGGVSSVNSQTGVVVLDTDDISEATTNKWFTESRVLNTILAGFTLATATAINASDSVLIALGKIQAQFNANLARFQNSTVIDGTGLKFPSVDAVNAMANYIALPASATGFLRTDDNFTMSVVTQGSDVLTSVLGISASQYGIAFKSGFETLTPDTFAAVKHLTSKSISLTAGTLGADAPTAGTNKILYVGWVGASDTIVFSNNTFVQSKTICQLGLIFVKNVAGIYSFTDINRTFSNIPDISAYNNLQTTSFGTQSNIVAASNGAGLTFRTTSGSIKGISINWGSSNTDERSVAAQTPTTFTFLNPSSSQSIPLPTGTTTVDPTQYYNGTIMATLGGNNRAQVMRVMLTSKGTFILQPGETNYTTLAIAKDNVFTQIFTNFIPRDTFVEVARIAIRQGASNLNDNGDAVFYTLGVGGGGATSSTTFTTISGSPYDNTLLAAELNSKANNLITINTQTSSYTLVLGDAAGLVRMNVASANTLTVPPNSSVAFAIGTQIVLSQAGAGQTTVVAGSGVTVNSSGGKLKLFAQYSGATLIKTATDVWTLFGELAT